MLSELLIALLLVTIVVMVYKLVKHNLVRKGFKYAIVLLLFIAGLFLINHYVDVGSALDSGKDLASVTGAAVKDSFEESFDTNLLEMAEEKLNSMAKK